MKKLYFLILSLLIFISCNSTKSSDTAIIEDAPDHETLKINSKILGEERTINIWLPPQYKDSETKFPVLYMPDGGIKEDFPHVAKTIAELVEAKKIFPIILVGIENIERRKDLTGPTTVESDKKVAPVVGKSANFRKFIKSELMPEISSKYRTTNEKGIIGESLAGYFVMETLFLEPNTFDYYIAFDPSLWWNNHQLVENSHKYLRNYTTPKKLWFAGSQATDIQPYTKELSTLLKINSYRNLDWNYSPEPNEKHETIFKATKEKALLWTLGK